MAAKKVPFLAVSELGDRLFTGVQKVFKAANVPAELVKNPAQATYGSHILAGPLPAAMVSKLANDLSLTTKVTSGRASAWYPDTMYPSLPAATFRNLYNEVNPSFAQRGASSTVPAVTAQSTADEVAVADIEKEFNRGVNAFFTSEATDSLRNTFTQACNTALQGKGDRQVVTVVHKPMELATSQYDDMLKNVTKAESDVRAEEFRSKNLAVEMANVGAAWPKMVAFPESLGCVVCPPTEYGAELEGLYTGLAGGNGMVAQRLAGPSAQVYTCANDAADENPTGVLLSAADLLAGMGMSAEADKIVKALEKTYAAKTLPSSVPGGKANLDAFVDAVCKNC